MTRDQSLEAVCRRLGLKLPPSPQPVGVYLPLVLEGGVAYLSGQISKDAEGRLLVGKVGEELTLEEGRRAAQWAALQTVSLIRREIGLERVAQILRMVGLVQSSPTFYAQSEVVNAASELFLEIFGHEGRHARTALGVSSLPFNAAVELELTLKVEVGFPPKGGSALFVADKPASTV